MYQAPLRPPSYLQPRLKAVPTSSSTAHAALATATPPQLSRSSSPNRQTPSTHPNTPFDTSDKATAALIRRVLCPHAHGSTDPRPTEELLPPLTSRNDIDLQLYAIIAIVVKEFVYSWYGKITPDQGFVEEVVGLVAHCTRALEGRLRAIDLENVIFDELPELVENHINAYRIGHESSYRTPLFTDPRVIYHTLYPHPALSPIPDPALPSTITEQSEHEAKYRQLLIQGVLAVLLPTEDLENACLRTLVADVIGEMILGNSLGGKACECWFVWEGITKTANAVKALLEPKTSGNEIKIDTRNRLEKFGLLSNEGGGVTKQQTRRSLSSEILWRILQYGYLTFVTARFIILGLVAASSRPPRVTSTWNIAKTTESSPINKSSEPPRPLRPTLTFKIFSFVSSLLDLPIRMPWLSGSLSLLQYRIVTGPLKLGATNGTIDQFLHNLLHSLLSPSCLPPTLLALRTTLFPLNTLAAAPVPPSASQYPVIKRTCALSLLALLPPALGARFFNTGDEEVQIREVEVVLDVFGDGYLNRHLGYAVLELVVVRLVPEMGEKGVRELMEGRLG